MLKFPEGLLQSFGCRVVKKFRVPEAKTTDISKVLSFQPSMCIIMLGENYLDSYPDDLNLKSLVQNFMKIIDRL